MPSGLITNKLLYVRVFARGLISKTGTYFVVVRREVVVFSAGTRDAVLYINLRRHIVTV
jgi:hypothetical protein